MHVMQAKRDLDEAEARLHLYKFYILFVVGPHGIKLSYNKDSDLTVSLRRTYVEVRDKKDKFKTDLSNIVNMYKRALEQEESRIRKERREREEKEKEREAKTYFEKYKHSWVFVDVQKEQRRGDPFFRINSVYFPKIPIKVPPARILKSVPYPAREVFENVLDFDKKPPPEHESFVNDMRIQLNEALDEIIRLEIPPASLEIAFLSGSTSGFLCFNEEPGVSGGKIVGQGTHFNTTRKTQFFTLE